jgi:hypothetical protein
MGNNQKRDKFCENVAIFNEKECVCVCVLPSFAIKKIT